MAQFPELKIENVKGVGCSDRTPKSDVLIHLKGSLSIKKRGAGAIELCYESNGLDRVTGVEVDQTAKSLVDRLRRDADLIEKYFTDESTNQG